MSVGEDGGLTRHDTTTRCFLGGAAGSRPPMSDHRGGLDSRRSLPSDTGRSVSQCQTATVDRVNVLFELAAAASAAASPAVCFSQASCTTAGAVPRDRVAVAWWVPDCDCVLKFRLSVINQLIHNRLSIMEKIRK